MGERQSAQEGVGALVSGDGAGLGEVSPSTLRAAAAGRHEAFEAIVREYDERLRAFAFSLMRDRNAMDDVLQDVYVKAYRALPGFRGDSRLSTWLLRITYTTCMSRLRLPPPELPLVDDGTADEAPSPEELVDLVHRRGQLAEALAALPPDLRACVLLVHREGLSYREAGDVLGVRPGTVGWRLSAARRRLREALEEVRTYA
jgi:RNA polymerase sigma-70 factor (ECF subfamily)